MEDICAKSTWFLFCSLLWYFLGSVLRCLAWFSCFHHKHGTLAELVRLWRTQLSVTKGSTREWSWSRCAGWVGLQQKVEGRLLSMWKCWSGQWKCSKMPFEMGWKTPYSECQGNQTWLVFLFLLYFCWACYSHFRVTLTCCKAPTCCSWLWSQRCGMATVHVMARIHGPCAVRTGPELLWQGNIMKHYETLWNIDIWYARSPDFCTLFEPHGWGARYSCLHAQREENHGLALLVCWSNSSKCQNFPLIHYIEQ